MKRKAPKSAFKKGNKAAAGRGQNKISKTVKETVLEVFKKLQEDPKGNLFSFAKEYPREFYNIAAKLIPTDIAADLTSKGEKITTNVIVLSNGQEIEL